MTSLLRERDRDDVVSSAALTPKLDPLTVVPGSELQVLGSVVPPIAVDVMDGLSREQWAPKQSGHDEPVLQDVAVLVGVGVLGSPNAEVAAGFLDAIQALPRAGHGPGLAGRVPLSPFLGVARVLASRGLGHRRDLRARTASAGAETVTRKHFVGDGNTPPSSHHPSSVSHDKES